MDRAFLSGAAATPPAAPASPSVGYPTSGNPGTGTPATKPGPWWYHMITEELLAIIVAAGITPASGTLNQVLQALRSAGVFVTQAVSDNSTKAATTAWVRGAMSDIATAAGFAYSWGVNWYIKFPAWLGGWVVQGGSVVTLTTGDVWFSFPVSFPNSVFQVYVSPVLLTGGGYAGWNGPNTGGVAIGGWNTSSSRVALTVSVLAVGR